jgi:hypothetical protein
MDAIKLIGVLSTWLFTAVATSASPDGINLDVGIRVFESGGSGIGGDLATLRRAEVRWVSYQLKLAVERYVRGSSQALGADAQRAGGPPDRRDRGRVGPVLVSGQSLHCV